MTIQLIKKDFRAHWKLQLASMSIPFILSLVYILVLDGSASMKSEATLLFSISVIMSSKIVSLLFMKIDEAYYANIVIASLPVTRSQIVIARYVSSFIQILMALVTHLLAVGIGLYFRENLNYELLGFISQPMYWVIILLITVSYLLFTLPFCLNFGLKKVVAGILTIQFVLIPIGFLSLLILSEIFQINWASSWSFIIALILLAGLVLIMAAGSVAISLYTYNKKDL